MAVGGLIGLLLLAGIVIGGILLVRRFLDRRGTGESEGGDVIAYLLLALAVGVASFSLAELAQVAFPGDTIVFDTDQRVATSLAGLVVTTPVAVFLWRRQARRRAEHPAAAGWTIYLALTEAVFMTSFVISAFGILSWAIGERDAPAWTDALVFAGILVFNELAARKTPPRSDAADLPRVIGSAIGLITLAMGVGGFLFWLFDRLYATFQATAGQANDVETWIPLLIIGAPIWWYRWWRPWEEDTGVPRNAWLFLTSVGGLATAFGAGGWLVAQIFVFLFTETEGAGSHFEALPGQLAVGMVGLLVWIHHRRLLGTERTNTIRSYEYAMTAIGLGTAIGSATALTTFAFGSSDLRVGTDDIISVTVALVLAMAVWGWFWSRASKAPREIEASTPPRRFYLLGYGVITGLVSAGALIATLVVLFQWLLDSGRGDTLAAQASLFIYAGLATWHLLRTNARDRELIVSEEVVTPFNVTIVCSHPGLIANVFPKEARLRVVYRNDEVGVITEDMANDIVAAVGHRSSLVWVDEDGFRTAPAR